MRSSLLSSLGALLSVAVVACSGDRLPQPPSDPGPPPENATGTLTVQIRMEGNRPDPDGLIIAVEGSDGWTEQAGVPAPVPSSGSRHTFNDLEPGNYFVSLSDVAQNCEVLSSMPHEAVVSADQLRFITIELECEPVGFRVVSTTLGAGQTAPYQIEALGTVYDIAPGAWVDIHTPPGQVVLTVRGVADECTVVGGAARSVTATYGGLLDVDVGVICLPLRNHIAFASDRDFTGEDHERDFRAWDIFVSPVEGGGIVNLMPGPLFGRHPSWSPDGTQIAFEGPDGIWLMNADGSSAHWIGSGGSPRWSPDGTRLLVRHSGHWTMNPDGTDYQFVVMAFCSADWSPDGQRIAFNSGQDCGPGDPGYRKAIYTIDLDGSDRRRVTSGATPLNYDMEPAWDPGNDIVFVGYTEGWTSSDIYTVHADGSRLMRLTNLPTDQFAYEPDWSPDGEWIAYTAPAGENRHICVMRRDGSAKRCITSGDGYDAYPSWSPME